MLLLQLLRLLLLALHVSRVFIIAEDTRIARKKTEKRRQKGKKSSVLLLLLLLLLSV